MTLDEKIQTVVALVGAVSILSSAIATFVNHSIRMATDAGFKVPGWLLTLGAGVNVLAVNLDKAVQLTKMARGQDVAATVTGLPAAPAVTPVEPPKP